MNPRSLGSRMEGASRRFSTGLTFLDRELDGGVEVGGLVALVAPPTSQSEVIIGQLMSVNRTCFVSTTRPEDEVRDWLAAHGAADADWTVTAVDPAELRADVEAATADLAPESLLVVDPIDLVEDATTPEYLAFLDDLKARLRETDSVGVVHCFSEESPSKQRQLTLHRADQVWEVQVMVLSREIKTRLLITKSRHGRALTNPIHIVLTDRVQVDTSRRIS